MEGWTWQLKAEAYRNWEPLSFNQKELNSDNNLNEPGSGNFSSQTSRRERSLASTLTRPWWDSKAANQLSTPGLLSYKAVRWCTCNISSCSVCDSLSCSPRGVVTKAPTIFWLLLPPPDLSCRLLLPSLGPRRLISMDFLDLSLLLIGVETRVGSGRQGVGGRQRINLSSLPAPL